MAVTATTAAVLAGSAAAIAAAGAISQGISARETARAQADVAEQQADQARRVAKQREDDFRRRQKRAASFVRAAGGASGVDFSTGSPLLASEDFARETEKQAQRIREGGLVEATRLEQQAGFLRDRGQAAFRSGIFGAGSSLLSGGARTGLILSDAERTTG